jgi:putative tryptophan/tyrosine transport system substrate-binding protein
MISRRQFVQSAGAVGAGLMAGCGRWPGRAPPDARLPVIGYLSGGAAATVNPVFAEALRQGLRDYGYTEGQHVVVERRYAEGQAAHMPGLARELVNLPVDLILTTGVGTAEATRDATSVIPIVVIYPSDPVASGLVASLARPGGNITGLTEFHTELGPKRMQLLKEASGASSRLVVIRDPDTQAPGQLQRAAYGALGLEILSLDVRGPSDLDAAFDAAVSWGAEAVFLGGGFNYRNPALWSRVVALEAQHQLPAMYGFREAVEAGGLMAYATSFPALLRRAGYFVGRILKGAQPADLPVEQPREFDFAINLKTAQALGLTIPHHVLLQATEVIQ